MEVEALLPTAPTSPLYADVRTPPLPAKPAASAPDGEAFEAFMARLATKEDTTAQPSPAKGLYLQLGAFSGIDNAESLRSHLTRELDWLTETIEVQPSAGVYRVHLGPYASRADADKVAERIRSVLGYRPTFVNR